MMSTSTLLFLIACGQFLLSVQGLTLRLNGERIIPRNGEMNITDLPVGGYRRYDSLECLSDVPYRGIIVEKAYWMYTDNFLVDHEVDDIRCKTTGRCKNPEIGWQSSKGIYRNKTDKKYYGVVRLGRTKENAEMGHFTCHFEGDSNSPVSVYIVTMRTVERINIMEPVIEIENITIPDNNGASYNISWDPPNCDVDSYTLYYTTQAIIWQCQNITLDRDATDYIYGPNGLKEIQIAAHLNDMTKCSKVYDVETGEEKEMFANDCNSECDNG